MSDQTARRNPGEPRVVLHARVLADRGGGPEKTILAAPALLRGSPYRPVAVYLHPPGAAQFDELVQRAGETGCELIGVPDRGPLDPAPFRSLLRLCRRLDVAVWHAHDYKSAVLGVLLRRLHRMRLVETLHGWVDVTPRSRFYFAVDRCCLPMFDHVFAVSADLAATARRCGVAAGRLSMLGNGVDECAYRRRVAPADAALRRQLAVPEGRRIVAAVSRLVPAKGLDVALDAFADLVASGVDAALWVVGDGPEREPLERCAGDLALASRVHFFGHYGDVRPVLEAADLFLSASRREGTPNAVLEAMAMEVPVVATDVGGIAELIGDTGRLCAAGDSTALALAMRELLGDGELRLRLANAGRLRVRSCNSLRERTRHEVEVYDRLLAEAGA